MKLKLQLQSNPVRLARVSLGLTLEAVSELASVHVQAWYLTECGCYTEIPPAISSYLQRKGIHLGELQADYTGFVVGTRTRFSRAFGPFNSLPKVNCLESPVVTWRGTLNLSRAALAKGACIQPAVLYKCET